MHLGISFIDALLDLSQLIVSAIEDAYRRLHTKTLTPIKDRQKCFI